MGLGGAALQVAKARFLGREQPRRPDISAHEYGCGRAQIGADPFQDGADFGLALLGEGEPAFQPLGGEWHQAAIDDVAGVLEVGGEGEDGSDALLVASLSVSGSSRAT